MKGVSHAQFPFTIRLEGKVVNREAFQSEYTEYNDVVSSHLTVEL